MRQWIEDGVVSVMRCERCGWMPSDPQPDDLCARCLGSTLRPVTAVIEPGSLSARAYRSGVWNTQSQIDARDVLRRVVQFHRMRRDRTGYPEPQMEVIAGGPEAYAIYALVDPNIPDVVRYVGQSQTPCARYQQHCKGLPWAKQLRQRSVRPLMLLIEKAVTREEAIRREEHWIGHYRALGMADLNRFIPSAGVAA